MGNETSAYYIPSYLHDFWTDNSTVSSVPPEVILDKSVAVNAVQICLGISMSTVNAILIVLLFINRARIQWKRYGLVLSFTTGDFVSGFILTVIASIWVPLLTYQSTIIVIVLEALKFFSLIISTFTYAGMMVLQYVALKKPLLYRLKLSIRYVFYLAVGIWIFAPLYVIVKSRLIIANPYHIKNFALAEILQGLGIGFVIFVCYLYILRVACGQNKRRRLQKGNSLSLTCLNKNGSAEYYANRQQQQLQQQHNRNSTFNNKFLLISGLRMISFVLTLTPICVYSLVRIAADQNDNYRRIKYAYNTTTRHYLLLLWFSRGLTDPIVHLILDSRLWRRNGGANIQSVPGSSF